MYSLDLQAILQILANQSGELFTTVTKVKKIKGKCQVHIVLNEGKIVSCNIEHKGQVLLAGKDAFHFLGNAGVLEWNYTPHTPSLSPSKRVTARLSGTLSEKHEGQSMSNTFSAQDPSSLLCPVRIRQVPAQEVVSWSLPMRSIYNLSTGEKSVAEIAHLLSMAPETFMQALKVLIQSNAIVLQRSPRY